jgi:hypothetical protein
MQQWATKYLDYIHFTTNLTQVAQDGFLFPSEFVGQFGCYDAIRHVYKSSKQLEHLAKSDSVLVSRQNFGIDLEQAISSIRTNFREEHGIAEDVHLSFVAPGNEKDEVIFCLDAVRRGIKQFQLKYSYPTSLSPNAPPADKFVTVISVHKGSDAEAYVNE